MSAQRKFRNRKLIYSNSIDFIVNVPHFRRVRSITSTESDRKTKIPEWVQLVLDSVEELQFGIVQIVVHNSKVVQIEKTEKLRLDQSH